MHAVTPHQGFLIELQASGATVHLEALHGAALRADDPASARVFNHEGHREQFTCMSQYTHTHTERERERKRGEVMT